MLQLRIAPAARQNLSAVQRLSVSQCPCRPSVIAHASAAVPSPGDGASSSPITPPQPASNASASSSSPADGPDVAPPSQKPGIFQRIKQYFVGDKATDKQKLAALGMGAFLAYGVVSNLTYGTCLTIAWITMVKTTGYSPIMPGQWKTFLAFYAGMWTIQNFLRPARIPLAIAMAPPFENLMQRISERTGLKKRWAFGIMLGLVAACTLTGLGSALYLLGGFPPTPPELLNQAA